MLRGNDREVNLYYMKNVFLWAVSHMDDKNNSYNVLGRSLTIHLRSFKYGQNFPSVNNNYQLSIILLISLHVVYLYFII